MVESGVVDAQLAALRRTTRERLVAEGFGAVHVLSSAAEVDAVQLIRAPKWR